MSVQRRTINQWLAGLPLAGALPLGRSRHARAHHGTRFATRRAHEILLRHRRHFDLQIDAVDQRP